MEQIFDLAYKISLFPSIYHELVGPMGAANNGD